MITYRICRSVFKNDISGNGAKLYGSRWNTKGMPMLFTAGHISLSALEMLVHINFMEIPDSFHLLQISIPDEVPAHEIKLSKLKPAWKHDEEYTAFIGDEFLRQNEALFLKVPSAVIPEENNYIINPLHRDFPKVKLIKAKPFTFDKRFFSS
ncbi:MAG: RES family NAD+ phosphorylase [Ferruginibacter sp.]